MRDGVTGAGWPMADTRDADTREAHRRIVALVTNPHRGGNREFRQE